MTSRYDQRKKIIKIGLSSFFKFLLVGKIAMNGSDKFCKDWFID